MRYRPIAFLTSFLIIAELTAEDSLAQVLAITHVNVIDTKAGMVIPDRTVVIQDSRIAAVGNMSDIPKAAEIIDGRNKFLIPGLWDMHVHLSYARSSALPALVANGVTSVRDVGSNLAEIDQWRGEIVGGTLIGPAIIRAGPMLNGKEFNPYQLEVTNATEGRTAVRTLKNVGVDFIKVHRRVPRSAYFAVADEAKRMGLPFTGHIPMSVTPAEASDAGQSIEHTYTLFEGTFAAEHGGKIEAADIAKWRATDADALFAKFVRNGTFVDPTLITQEYLLRLVKAGHRDPHAIYIAASARAQADKTLTPTAIKELLDSEPVLLAMGAVTNMMNRAGVHLLAGTDLSFLHPPGFILQDELASLVDSGLTAADALRTATVNPGLLFHSDNGIIVPGAPANLVLLDANPLDDIRNTQKIRAVVLRGRYFNRQALDRLLEKAAQFASTN